MAAIPESREVSEMHANRLVKEWANAHALGGEPPFAIFSAPQFDTNVLIFRDDVQHTVRNNVDHGRGVALVLAERILSRVRRMNGQRAGVSEVEWKPLDPDDAQDWEQAAQTILTDVAHGDYQGAATAYDYLVATSNDYLEVAQLVGAFTTLSYFLKNPENSAESA